jgi:hypothetical protein
MLQINVDVYITSSNDNVNYRIYTYTPFSLTSFTGAPGDGTAGTLTARVLCQILLDFVRICSDPVFNIMTWRLIPK